jgi:hypothetical protein
MTEKIFCDICHKNFTRVDNMKRHQETVHKSVNSEPIVSNLLSKITELQSELREKNEQLELKMEKRDEQLQSELHSLKDRLPKNIINNQILNVICVTNQDNYLDMLTNTMGNFDQAIEYIKDCALSDLAGDCKLIEKIYTNQNHELSFTLNPKQSRVTYHNDQHEKITESKEVFGRKLANNLQNSYLKGINYLINDTLDSKRNPNHLLEDHDLLAWNQHIYQLSDYQHQRKLLSQLHLSATI